MLILLGGGAFTAYWIALHSATLAYDRSLLNTALAISEQIHVVDGYPALQLTAQAKKILLTDKYDSMFFAVLGPENELISGFDLPLPTGDQLPDLIDSSRLHYNSRWEGRPIRIAALRTEVDGIALTILSGETLNKRNAIVRDILLGMLLPELGLIVATFVMLTMGIRSGLSPLTKMIPQLAGRSQADLSPIVAVVPDELRPLVIEINSLLERLDNSLTTQRHFVSNAAHQLRTPIAALQAQVEVALRTSNTEAQAGLAGILQACRRLSHLVDQLLALARAEPCIAEPRPLLQIESVIHDVAELWLPRAIFRNIDLGFELGKVPVRGNALLLREMLSNLIDNAIRHTPEHGSITVSCWLNENIAWLAVDDSGSGIPVGEREKIFERFYQPAGSTSEGCGLGLAIVKSIVFQHGGRIAVLDSTTLGGARFEIRLPAASGDGTTP